MEYEKPLYRTGNMVITDSGFCVLKELIDMFDIKVYVSELANKRRY